MLIICLNDIFLKPTGKRIIYYLWMLGEGLFVAIQTEQQLHTTEIWLELEPYIKKLCEYKLKSMPNVIDDCVQEVFFAYIDAINKGQTIEHPKAWLTTVANNKIKDIYKIAKKENERVIPLSHEEAVNYPSSVYGMDNTLYISDEQIEQIKKNVLNQLTDEELKLIEEYYVQRIKLKSLAKNYHYSESKMKQVMFKLRIKIINLSKSAINQQDAQNKK